MRELGTIKVAKMRMKKEDFVNATPSNRQAAYEYMIREWLETLIKLNDYKNVKELQIRIILEE